MEKFLALVERVIDKGSELPRSDAIDAYAKLIEINNKFQVFKESTRVMLYDVVSVRVCV